MARARLSSKYRIVIPKEVREQLATQPGQEFQIVATSGMISLVPDKPIAAMRGFVRGIRTSGFR